VGHEIVAKSTKKRTLLFVTMPSLQVIVEDPYRETSLNLADPSLEIVSSTVGIDHALYRCWIRAANGIKKDISWVWAADNDLLKYLASTWAIDATQFVMVFRRMDRPSPATTPIQTPHTSQNDLLSLPKATENKDRLKQLQANTHLWNRLLVFLNDLQTFSNDEDARSRLEYEPQAKLYISSAYFTSDEVEMLLNFPSGTGLTLEQTLQFTMEEKMKAAAAGSSRNYEVCTSHDLAPVVSSLFEVRKGFREERVFKEYLKTFNKQWRKRMKKEGR
jgi:hypothetical protein